MEVWNDLIAKGDLSNHNGGTQLMDKQWTGSITKSSALTLHPEQGTLSKPKGGFLPGIFKAKRRGTQNPS